MKSILIVCAFLIVVMFGAVGLYIQNQSHAATPYVTAEAEAGSNVGNAASSSATDASGGKYVKFGSAATSSSLPKQGVSPGYKIITRNAADRRAELDKIVRVLNGKPGFVRVDSTAYNQAQVEPLIADMLDRRLTPLILLYGTTTPRAADGFGHDQAVKWLGKATYFEVANEPELNGWTANGYADFLNAVGTSVKSGNPNAVVIGGAMSPSGGTGQTVQDYCRAMATRAKGSFSILSAHLYGDSRVRANWNVWDRMFPVLYGSNSVYKGSSCRDILDANGSANVGIISTESGDRVTDVGEAGQQTAVAHAFDAVDAGLLQSMLVYNMANDDGLNFGMLRDDNTERPAFTTFMSRAQ